MLIILKTDEIRRYILNKYGLQYSNKENHHIVARKDSRAETSRKILILSGIGINDDINIVAVNKSYHKSLHTDAYYYVLNTSMVSAYILSGRTGVKKFYMFISLH